MLGKVVLAGLLIVLAMVAVKNGWVLRRSGLIGSCTVYANAAGGAQWEICGAGLLEGRPDLSRNGCTGDGFRGRFEYWYCPAGLESLPAGV